MMQVAPPATPREWMSQTEVQGESIPCGSRNKVGKAETNNTSLSRTRTKTFLEKFSQLVSRHFKCPICQCLLKDPAILECHHLFCRECLHEWIQVLLAKSEIRSCPICRKLIRNFAETSDIPSSTMLSFLSQFTAVEQVFKHDFNHLCETDRMTKLLHVLDIPYNFKNIEMVYSINYSRYLSAGSRKAKCVALIDQIRESHNIKLIKGIKPVKTKWQLFQGNIKNTFRMLCPGCLNNLITPIHEYCLMWTTLQGQWIWTRPKPIFYVVILITIFYFYIVYHFGSAILTYTGLKTPVKRLFQHIIFVCFDTPTFELVNIVREAFLQPL